MGECEVVEIFIGKHFLSLESFCVRFVIKSSAAQGRELMSRDMHDRRQFTEAVLPGGGVYETSRKENTIDAFDVYIEVGSTRPSGAWKNLN